MLIKGTEVELRFNHRFYKNIVKGYKSKDADGFSNFINGLIQKDPDALIAGYKFGIVGKKFTDDEVADALEDNGIFDKGNPYKDLYKEVVESGFLKAKIQLMKKSAEEDYRTIKELLNKASLKKDEKEALENQFKMTEQQYLKQKKAMEELAK